MKDFLVKVVGELNIGTGPNDARSVAFVCGAGPRGVDRSFVGPN